MSDEIKAPEGWKLVGGHTLSLGDRYMFPDNQGEWVERIWNYTGKNGGIVAVPVEPEFEFGLWSHRNPVYVDGPGNTRYVARAKDARKVAEHLEIRFGNGEWLPATRQALALWHDDVLVEVRPRQPEE